ncbi:hypothetical protein Palpr_0219 [Paludibacter propionicigenes WB4]|uniref:Uncharacterized protein n=1 Tax=Paludibacter propionicigenes (strain DSM 17365 / JCM 13257 / WB4) TaxID=694427 RepID=E4T100_PALPW|nr:hypothetical protein [Paludibacter propionicigenes]ADQ78381.1 hypothetical protein Palpr_0219 [Paludibacter propionicigenes WB4]
MSNSDYIPRSDGEFNSWQESLVSNTEPNVDRWQISREDYATLNVKKSVWDTSYAKASNKQNRTAADVADKKEARADYESYIRSFVAQWLSNNSRVSDSDRTRMGLTVKTGTRTSVAKPETSPVASIDFSTRKRHIVNFADEASPRSKAKPAGVHGCEIYIKVDGEAPKLVSELKYLTTCTASPYEVDFDGDQAGKMAYYWLRWVNTHGESGPWSITASAMIVG